MDQRVKTLEETVKRMGFAFREEIRQVSEEKDKTIAALQEKLDLMQKEQEEIHSRFIPHEIKKTTGDVYTGEERFGKINHVPKAKC